MRRTLSCWRSGRFRWLGFVSRFVGLLCSLSRVFVPSTRIHLFRLIDQQTLPRLVLFLADKIITTTVTCSQAVVILLPALPTSKAVEFSFDALEGTAAGCRRLTNTV